MAKKTTNNRKRAKAAKQKQKLMITGGLLGVLIFVIILAVVVLGGCSSYESDTNTVYILENGKVVSNSVEEFDENLYNKDDLDTYIDGIVAAYNAENGDVIKQKSLNVKDGIASLVMEYANEDVYEAFEGVDIFVGTVAEAVEAGFTFEGEFANVTDGTAKACTTEEFLTGEYKVVIIKANINVSLEKGQICYVSSVNTQSVVDGLVVIKEGVNLLATAIVENTEVVTESTEIEGAISEDELLTGEETDIIFDFGDEEAVTNPYSNVYTYIIFK